MGPHDAKMQSLDSIIDLMDHQMMGKAKRKGAPADVQPPLAPPAEGGPAALAEAAAAPEAAPAAAAGEDEELRQLMELYGQDTDEPAPINGGY